MATKQKETIYFKELTFKCEPTFEERDSIIRRAILVEQPKYKSLRWIIVDMDFKKARIKFFAKTPKKK